MVIKTKKFGYTTHRIKKIGGKTFIFEGKYEKKLLANKAVSRLKTNKNIRTRIIKSGKYWNVWYYNAEGLRIQKKRGY